MKKVLIISAIIVFLGFTMIGCGEAPKPPGDSTGSREVTLWSSSATNIEEWNDRKADIDSKFNIKLNIVSVPDNQFVQKLQTALLSGEGYPDIIDWRIENNQIINADPKKSFVLPLDNYVATSTVFQTVIPGRVSWLKYGGHTYGLPRDAHPVVMVYNDTLWKSVGVDVAALETWDDFFTAAQKLTAEKVDGNPVHYALPYQGAGLSDTMFMMWQQTGAQILDPTGAPAFESPAFKAFVYKWIQWYNTGVFCTWDWGGFGAMLQNGILASYITPDWWVSQVDTAAAEGAYQFKVRQIPYYSYGGSRSASWGGFFLAICKLAKNPDQLYKIIEYMQYDENGFLKYRYPLTQMIPPFSTVWDSPLFNQNDWRFGGQKLGSLQIQVAQSIPSINTGDIFWDAINAFGSVYPQIQNGSVSVDDGLHTVQVNAGNLVH